MDANGWLTFFAFSRRARVFSQKFKTLFQTGIIFFGLRQAKCKHALNIDVEQIVCRGRAEFVRYQALLARL